MTAYARQTICAALGLGWCLLVAGSAPGRADETFLCRDGSSVTIDDDNRVAMQDHPCVRAWFADDRAQRKARAALGAAAGPDVQPVLHRYSVHRAAALRDLRQRPAYVAWSRARTVPVRSVAQSTSAVPSTRVLTPPSQPLGVTIRVPAGR